MNQTPRAAVGSALRLSRRILSTLPVTEEGKVRVRVAAKRVVAKTEVVREAISRKEEAPDQLRNQRRRRKPDHARARKLALLCRRIAVAIGHGFSMKPESRLAV